MTARTRQGSTRRIVRTAATIASVGAVGVALAACSPGEDPTDAKGTTPAVVTGDQAPAGGGSTGGSASATASLIDTKGNPVGTATFAPSGSSVQVTVKVTKGLPAGFHGMHLHSNGVCTPNGAESFTSAGGHLQVGGRTAHPASGDLVSINILKDGTGQTVTTTDAVTLDQIVGKAIVIHEKPDNFGNIPSRYAPPADEQTMSTGDAGARIACGVIEKPQNEHGEDAEQGSTEKSTNNDEHGDDSGHN